MLILSGIFLLVFQQSATSMVGIGLIAIGVFVGSVDFLSSYGLQRRSPRGFEQHREETKEHVARLEEVFDAVDEVPEERPSPAPDVPAGLSPSFRMPNWSVGLAPITRPRAAALSSGR